MKKRQIEGNIIALDAKIRGLTLVLKKQEEKIYMLELDITRIGDKLTEKINEECEEKAAKVAREKSRRTSVGIRKKAKR